MRIGFPLGRHYAATLSALAFGLSQNPKAFFTIVFPATLASIISVLQLYFILCSVAAKAVVFHKGTPVVVYSECGGTHNIF